MTGCKPNCIYFKYDLEKIYPWGVFDGKEQTFKCKQNVGLYCKIFTILNKNWPMMTLVELWDCSLGSFSS